MRLSELSGKEIVNLMDGARLGVVGNADLAINPSTGKIEKLLIPVGRGYFSMFRDAGVLEIPWSAIKRIGDDLIIVEFSPRGEEPNYLLNE